jgi:predicted DCC family thiol-disulfide oxidoreductase YuxK
MDKLTVWFDSGCPLCQREIALMRGLDQQHAIIFVDVASDTATCPINRAELLARFHAQEGDQLLSGAAAFAAMWRAIPALRPLGILARSPLVLAALEQLYRLFLRVRPRLQALVRKRDTNPAAS